MVDLGSPFSSCLIPASLTRTATPLKFRDLIVMNLDPRMAPVKLSWSSDVDKRLELPMVGLQGDAFYRPMWTAPELAEYTGCVMAIDPSGRGKDETAYAIVKQLNGWLFVVASGGFKDGYGEATLKALSVLAEAAWCPEDIG